MPVAEEMTVLEEKPLDKQRTQELLAEFNREGVVWVGKLLDDAEVAFLKRRIDEIRADPHAIARNTLRDETDWSVARVFE